MPQEKIGDLAKEHNFSTGQVRAAIQRGELAGQKEGAFWVVDREEFEKWASKSKKKRSNGNIKPVVNSARRNVLSCTSCGSEDVKAASTVISQGTYSGTAKHTGVGIGSGGSVAVGFGSSNISYQSDAARNVKTVDEKNCAEEFGGSVGSFIGIILGFLIGISAQSFWIGFITAMICTFIGMMIGKSSNMGQSEAQRIRRDSDQFSRSYVCQRCGHQFHK